jgi:hypothetical protein
MRGFDPALFDQEEEQSVPGYEMAGQQMASSLSMGMLEESTFPGQDKMAVSAEMPYDMRELLAKTLKGQLIQRKQRAASEQEMRRLKAMFQQQQQQQQQPGPQQPQQQPQQPSPLGPQGPQEPTNA